MENKIIGQDLAIKKIARTLGIFNISKGEIRPHSFITGQTGTGKTAIVDIACKELDLDYIKINAASLTPEGSSGNSLSKVLTPLINLDGGPCVILVDEFDKLFSSQNPDSASKSLQNEFLKVLESATCQVFHDYGKYVDVNVDKCLFLFIGAFSNNADIQEKDLISTGFTPEFMGRVTSIINTAKLSRDTIFRIMDSSPLLKSYAKYYDLNTLEYNLALDNIQGALSTKIDSNKIGARLVDKVIHEHFISKYNDKN